MSAFRAIRQRLLTAPIFKWAQTALPAMSLTEAEAIEAGDTWWDAALFSGDPHWRDLLAMPVPRLTAEEQAFLEGPVEDVCRMVDDWQVRFVDADLSPEVWAFLKAQRFFGMIIPKEYGGLGFSAFAHSEVIRKLSTRSVTLAVTVMVPNSLGPGELLLQFGDQTQKQYYLPRLADGHEMPCFGLTSAEAGSDAAAMTDTGIVCWGTFNNERVLGLRLNWSKRYITLCPVATIIGLAVKVYDPDHLLGAESDLGISVLLVPTSTPGVTTGRRHYPAHQVFQNGPTQGTDVFLPLDHVIGGRERLGQGWKMLMSALAAGRGISLPSLSAAGAALSARSTGAYARIREQFGISIAKFEGVQAPLSAIGGTAYLLDAARRLTCAALDRGHRPAVIAAIMKAHATEGLRVAVNHAMDIHGGKAVMDGPHNYLGDLYRAVPVAITVEGANILTRNLMIFGQGAIRCHPYLLAEMKAIAARDLAAFDTAFWNHVGHSICNMARTFWRSWTSGRFAPSPDVEPVEVGPVEVGPVEVGPVEVGPVRHHYRQLSRYASVLAFLSDMAFLTLGGALKRRELLSARLGDILSDLYLLSAALKRFEDEGRQISDLPLVDLCLASGYRRLETAIDEIIANFPNRAVAGILRFVVPADARKRRGPSDDLMRDVAELMSVPGAARDRLSPNIYPGREDDPLALLETAFLLTHEAEPLRLKLRQDNIRDWRTAPVGALTPAGIAQLQATADAVARAVQVDDFAPAELTGRRVAKADMPSP